MRLVTYRLNEAAPRLGVIAAGLVIDVRRIAKRAGCALPKSMQEFIDLGPGASLLLAELLGNTTPERLVGCALPEGNVQVLAPIPRPRKNIFGIGLNYALHVNESASALKIAPTRPEKPVIFTKPPTSVISATDAIRHNKAITQQLDWETELAVIIGRTARHVSREDAMSYVFGYTVINDISARDCRRAEQFLVSKGQDTFAPMGPCIVTADEIPDPHNLNLSTRLNGVEKQNSNTRHMLFRIDELIADISLVMTLEPGDIIATGTPEGVGAVRKPPEFMWPGDVLESTVERIGTLRNPIISV